MIIIEGKKREFVIVFARCETCKFLDEEPTPCVCRKGKGQVAYQHKACAEYKKKKEAKNNAVH
jgi:hypothetical protein